MNPANFKGIDDYYIYVAILDEDEDGNEIQTIKELDEWKKENLINVAVQNKVLRTLKADDTQ